MSSAEDDLHVALGGFLSALFHALSGPDHLAALLPFVAFRRWYTAALLGTVWGLGHGVSSSCLGMIGTGLKGLVGSLIHLTSLVQVLKDWTSLFIAMTIVSIGLMGLYELGKDESAGEGGDDEEGDDDNNKRKGHSAKMPQPIFIAALFAQFANGFLLGLALDAIPSVAPGVLAHSMSSSLKFFAAYTLGTAATMALVSALVGQSTSWLGSFVSLLPARLALFSSYVSIAVGLLWALCNTMLYRVLLRAISDQGFLRLLLVLSPVLVIVTAWLALADQADVDYTMRSCRVWCALRLPCLGLRHLSYKARKSFKLKTDEGWGASGSGGSTPIYAV